MQSHSKKCFAVAEPIAREVDNDAIDWQALRLAYLRKRGGLLFILGVGER
jgi:hypothetical protein